MPRPLLRISASEPNASLVLRRRLDLLSQDYEVTNPQPRLLSDNGSCYISGELKSYLVKKEVEHIRGKPMHPQTQGKIERYHRTMKNRILLEHYYSPEKLERALVEFVDFYNNNRLHESLSNLTPADVYFKRCDKIPKKREVNKQKNNIQRRINHLLQNHNQLLVLSNTCPNELDDVH